MIELEGEKAIALHGITRFYGFPLKDGDPLVSYSPVRATTCLAWRKILCWLANEPIPLLSGI